MNIHKEKKENIKEAGGPHPNCGFILESLLREKLTQSVRGGTSTILISYINYIYNIIVIYLFNKIISLMIHLYV